jgi:hypothetical protein
MKKIATDLSAKGLLSRVNGRINRINIGDHKQISELESRFDGLIGENTEYISTIHLGHQNNNQQGIEIKYERTPNDIFRDVISLYSTGQGELTPEVAKPFFQVIDSHIFKLTDHSRSPASLGADLEHSYQLREQRIQSQERDLQSFFAKMEEFTLKQTQQYSQRVDELNRKFDAEKSKHEAEHQSRLDGLRMREDELNKRLIEFDTKESKGHRRAIQKKWEDYILETAKKLEFSRNTNVHFMYVIILLAIACALSLGLCIWMLSTAATDSSGVVNYVIVARQIGSIILTVGFITYFIRWLNRLFSTFAEEELRYKQMVIDAMRSGWLVETVLDWREQKETASPFPEELLDKLSRGLFISQGNDSEDEAASTAVARAIFGSATRMKVGHGGTEIDYERKDLRNLSKEPH